MSEGGGGGVHASVSGERPRRRRNAERDKPVIVPDPPAHSSFELGFCEDRNAPRRRKMEVRRGACRWILSGRRTLPQDSHAFFYDFGGVKDQGFFAVYDGHGGKSAAAWCGEHFHELLLKNLTPPDPPSHREGEAKSGEFIVPVLEVLDQTFAEADSYLNGAHGIFSGCTAIVALYRHEMRGSQEGRADGEDEEGEGGQEGGNYSTTPVLYTANVGDSRAVLLRGKRAVRLSYDHKGSDVIEQQRVKESGGFIMNDRVNGMLAITRALGDAEMKDFIAGRPYTTETVLRPGEDQLLILACDGLWDVCSDQEACELIRDEEDPSEAAHRLVEYAIAHGSFDNLSVLVIRFRQPPPA